MTGIDLTITDWTAATKKPAKYGKSFADNHGY